MMNKLLSLVIIFCILGCQKGADEPVFKFNKGDKVKHVIGGDIGIVQRAYYYKFDQDLHYYNLEVGVPYYSVKFVTDGSYGIDTAAGGGILGGREHFPPSKFIVERCEEFELEALE